MDAKERALNAVETYRLVMLVEPPEPATPLQAATRDFVFGQVWNRPGLSIRDRRLITLACVGAADSVQPMQEHIYATLKSGDLSLTEINEFSLQFAVYCGWPKASQFEQTVRAQWHRLHAERGVETPAWPKHTVDDLGEPDLEERIQGGRRHFAEVNLYPDPPSDSPYSYAGILNFVFGHVWLRPGLSRRDRRIITVACVGASDALGPIASHVTTGLETGDLSYDEMQELILQFSAYYGFAKGEVLQHFAQEWQTTSRTGTRSR